MKLYQLIKAQEVNAPLERVFDFFGRPENLEKLTPPWLKMQILTPMPVPMHVGSVIDYVVTVNGIPVRWTTLIAEHSPPERFVDVQVRGPYSFWHHTHRFEARGRRTLVSDEVVYALPMGPLGRLTHMLFVRRKLERIFSYRAQYLEREVYLGGTAIVRPDR